MLLFIVGTAISALDTGAAKVGGCGGVYTPPIIENYHFLPAKKKLFCAFYAFFAKF